MNGTATAEMVLKGAACVRKKEIEDFRAPESVVDASLLPSGDQPELTASVQKKKECEDDNDDQGAPKAAVF